MTLEIIYSFHPLFFPEEETKGPQRLSNDFSKKVRSIGEKNDILREKTV